MVIDYVWDAMENQRGYRDAIQIRLLALDSREEQTRQFEVAAFGLVLVRLRDAAQGKPRTQPVESPRRSPIRPG